MQARTIYLWALFNFTLTAVIGLLLRLFTIGLVTGFHYKNWLHTHSHMAFLGWVYPAIIAVIAELVPEELQRNDRLIKYLFWCMQCAIIGLMVTFPAYGYGWPSIVVLSIHMAASIWLVFHMINLIPRQFSIARSYIRAGAWLMVISGLGALALGPIAVLGLKYTPLYNASIYFYLHFQYNGWFFLALLGVVLALYGNKNEHDHSSLKKALKLLVVAIFTTYVLSILGFEVPLWINLTGSIGAVIQIVALAMISVYLLKNRTQLFGNQPVTFRWLLTIAFFFLWIKLIVQLISSSPQIVEITYKSRDLVIAYLHFFLLGIITPILLSMPFKNKWFGRYNKVATRALILFLTGFAITELILFIRGLAPDFRPPSDQNLLAVGAVLMLIGLVLLVIIALVDRVSKRGN